MAGSVKKTTGCRIVEIIAVEEGGVVGTTTDGENREGLPAVAGAAVPGQPSFFFENLPEVDGAA